jgi:hypothetical protein
VPAEGTSGAPPPPIARARGPVNLIDARFALALARIAVDRDYRQR